MADQKPTIPEEERKWWIDRGPAKQREKKSPQLGQGLIEQWVYGMLKDYSQEQAMRNVVDINRRVLGEVELAPGEWKHISLGVGKYPEQRLAAIQRALELPPDARALVIDAGYSVRVLITGEPPGERAVDINFTEAPSLDYWVRDDLVEERLFTSFEDALRKLRGVLPRYLRGHAPV